jgi:hypothetical protein
MCTQQISIFTKHIERHSYTEKFLLRIAYSAPFNVHIFQFLLIILCCRDGTLGAGDLAREAYTRGSTDNISLIIIDFNSSLT